VHSGQARGVSPSVLVDDQEPSGLMISPVGFGGVRKAKAA